MYISFVVVYMSNFLLFNHKDEEATALTREMSEVSRRSPTNLYKEQTKNPHKENILTLYHSKMHKPSDSKGNADHMAKQPRARHTRRRQEGRALVSKDFSNESEKSTNEDAKYKRINDSVPGRMTAHVVDQGTQTSTSLEMHIEQVFSKPNNTVDLQKTARTSNCSRKGSKGQTRYSDVQFSLMNAQDSYHHSITELAKELRYLSQGAASDFSPVLESITEQPGSSTYCCEH